MTGATGGEQTKSDWQPRQGRRRPQEEVIMIEVIAVARAACGVIV